MTSFVQHYRLVCGAAVLLAAAALAAATAAGSRSQGTVQGVTSDASGAAGGNTATPVQDAEGSIQAIRGIKGIDQVQLQNLEAVLRMQSPPPPPPPNSRAKKAVAVLTTDSQQQEEEELPDAREEHMELELEGS